MGQQDAVLHKAASSASAATLSGHMPRRAEILRSATVYSCQVTREASADEVKKTFPMAVWGIIAYHEASKAIGEAPGGIVRMRTVQLVVSALAMAAVLSIGDADAGTSVQGHRADALVLVNSTSVHFDRFRHFVKPYLDHFGVPYRLHDIASAPLGASDRDFTATDPSDFALLVIGHRRLDPNQEYLSADEQARISSAVAAGTGLVSFDNDLSADGSTGRYGFVQEIFDFGYGAPLSGSGISIEGAGIRVRCWEDDHQDPDLPTTIDPGELDNTDGEWTEYHHVSGARPWPDVTAGVDEEDLGLPLMRFHADQIPTGEYEVVALLYTSNPECDLRYYYGYAAHEPKAHFVDTVGGTGGEHQHERHSLGNVTITDGTFDLYVQDADLIGAGTYPFFGWAWIELLPKGSSTDELHYITERHEEGETLGTGTMTLPGIILQEGVTAIAHTDTQPFLSVTRHGEGRAVQWSSTDWMSHSVLGPLMGVDDLLWRSLVWAARKPFAMQGMPPLLTMRVDDESGGMGWVQIANEFGFKPWLGVFPHDFTEAEADELSLFVHAGLATASIHAWTWTDFFYYDHTGQPLPDEVVEANFAQGTQWHDDHDIPISTYLVPHFGEMGINALPGLQTWGIEFLSTMIEPNTSWGSPWIPGGPFRLHDPRQRSDSPISFYYSDYYPVKGHPELDGVFFNCVTEVRDITGYEWFPDNDVTGSIDRATRQLVREFDSMALPTLFTHSQYIQPITSDNWRATIAGIAENIAHYEPIHVTMDEGCRYARAMVTSDIESGTYDPSSGEVAIRLAGDADLPTMFYLFTEAAGRIRDELVDVPAFSGSVEVIHPLRPAAFRR